MTHTTKIVFLSLILLITSGAFAVIIDDFEDGEPKNYSFC